MSATLKPRIDPLLWAQLRPSVIHARKAGGEDANQPLSIGNVPLVPENKIATSLRVVLHDTKSVMEQFSDKLNNLLHDVDKTKRQIDKTNDNFESAHEKVLEELVATVNRCQKGLLEILDTPAQASVLDEVKSSQTDIIKKLEQLGTRVDFIQNSLQIVSDQQGQVLTCLASLTPLASSLQNVPQLLHHISSQLSVMQPLCQTLPDQLKLIQHETSVQNTQSIHNAFSAAFSTSMEKNLESLSRVFSESVKLITITSAEQLSNPQGSTTMAQNHDTTIQKESIPKRGRGRPRPNMNTSPVQDSPATLRPQSRRNGSNSNANLDETGDPSSYLSGSQETRSKQVSKRPRLDNTTARRKVAKNTLMSKRKPKSGYQSPACTTEQAKLTAKKSRANHAVSMPSKAKPSKSDVRSSDRVLRSRISQPDTTLFSEKRDKTVSFLDESTSSVNSTDKVSDPLTAHVYPSSPVAPTPLPKRRTLLPLFTDPDQQIDIELDWGQI